MITDRLNCACDSFLATVGKDLNVSEFACDLSSNISEYVRISDWVSPLWGIGLFESMNP